MLTRKTLLVFWMLWGLFLTIAAQTNEDSMENLLSSVSMEKFRMQKRDVKGLLVVPGVGREDRLSTLVESLRLLYPYLKGESAQWDCIVYVYAPRSDTSFWSSKELLKKVLSVCDIVENPGKRVTDNMRSVQPSLIKRHYNHVFVLLDDCKLVPSSPQALSWDLQKLLDVMTYNGLSVATPRIENANTGGGQQFRKIMQATTPTGTEGYVSSFVEVFAWVMTMDAYEALWGLLLPEVNPYGWGYDFWYNGYAQKLVAESMSQNGAEKKHKMGIVTSLSAKHEQSVKEEDNGSTDGRAESATVKEKWGAVQEQERYFKKYLNVDLKAMSSKMELANMSWNGAVKGYLLPVPQTYTKLRSGVNVGPRGKSSKGGKRKPRKGMSRRRGQGTIDE
jgi:hypothetical protein